MDSSTRILGGGMHTPPLVMHNGEFLSEGALFESIVDLAKRFFSRVSEKLSNVFTSSTPQERMPIQSAESAQRVQVAPQPSALDHFEESLLKTQTLSFQVGEDNEPQKDFEGNPRIQSIIKGNNLKPVNGTSIQALSQVNQKIETGLSELTVYGLNAQPFSGSAEETAKLIAQAAGMSVEEAFNGLSMQNPVSIFQAQMQQLFDPLTQEETDKVLSIYDDSGLMPLPPSEKTVLVLHPHQGDGSLRYTVKSHYHLGTPEGEVKEKYFLSQDVTIQKNGTVTIDRSGVIPS